MKKTKVYITSILVSLLLTASLSAKQSLHEQDCGQIHFRVNQSNIDSSYMDNNVQIGEMRQVFSKLLSDSNVAIDSICIASSTSPEGRVSFNTLLARRRIDFLKRFILQEFPTIDPSLIRTASAVEEWSRLGELAASDADLPLREQVVTIVNSTNSNAEKTKQLKALDKGDVYTYIVRHLLPSLRRMNECKVFYRLNESQSDTAVLAPPIHNIPLVPDTLSNTPIEQAPIPVPLAQSSERMFLVKTNLAYLSAGVSNIGIEYPLAKHWSVDLPFIFSPYTLARNYKLRFLAFQPEVRYWKNEAFKGHYLGMHLHTAWFNVATDSNNRYQDKNGNTPLWGAGLAYGYNLPLGNKWGLDFGIGAGYARLVYDTFVNESKGQKYDTSTRNYWGITRVGITLSYRINLKTAQK